MRASSRRTSGARVSRTISSISPTARRRIDFLYHAPEGPALNGPALILLDLNLPDMSGIDILQKHQGGGQPAEAARRWIVLTTTDDKVEIQRCYDLGANVLHHEAGRL